MKEAGVGGMAEEVMNEGLNEKIIPIQELSDMGFLKLILDEFNKTGTKIVSETGNQGVPTSEVIDRFIADHYEEGLAMIFKRGVALGIVLGSGG